MLAIAIVACITALAQPLSPEEAADQLRQLPPGSTITLERTYDGGNIAVEEEASGVGAGLNARGQEIVSDFNSSAPGAALGGGRSASGGDTETSNKVKGNDLWANPLLWAGILCLIGSGVAVYLRIYRAALVAGLLGGSLIAAVLAPLLMVFIVAAAVLVVVVPYIYKEWQSKVDGEDAHLKSETLRAVVAGVADFGKAAKDTTNPLVTPDSYDRLKSSIQSQLAPEEEAVVKAIKERDRL